MRLDNGKRWRAFVRGFDGAEVRVYSTTQHPASSYGRQVWVDAEGRDWGEIDAPSFYPFRAVEEVTEAEAERWENCHEEGHGEEGG